MARWQIIKDNILDDGKAHESVLSNTGDRIGVDDGEGNVVWLEAGNGCLLLNLSYMGTSRELVVTARASNSLRIDHRPVNPGPD